MSSTASCASSTSHSAWWRVSVAGRRAGTGPERPLHQYAVEPAPEFVPHIIERAYHPETRRAVQLDRGSIGGIADDGNHLAVAPGLRLVDETCKQGATDSLPMRSWCDIDRVFDRPIVGRSGAVRADISIPGNCAAEFGDQEWIPTGVQCPVAPGHFVFVRRIELERCRPVAHGCAVDLRDRRHVPQVGRTNQRRGAHGRMLRPCCPYANAPAQRPGRSEESRPEASATIAEEA